MKTCTNNMARPTPQWCHIGCYFTEADTPHMRAMNAPICTGNGGNVITDGKPVYRGDDVVEIDHNLRSSVWIGLIVCGLLWLVALGVLAYRVWS